MVTTRGHWSSQTLWLCSSHINWCTAEYISKYSL